MATEARSEHLVFRHATVLTQDDDLGEFADADIEVIDGGIAQVGPGLDAPGATEVDATALIALPGFVDTHWHVWGTLMRGAVGDGANGWFPRKAQLGPHFRAEDTYLGVRLGVVEGVSAGITTVHDWAHNVLAPEHADADLQAHLDTGTRVHFSYGSPSAHPSLSAAEMRSVLASTVRQLDEAMDFSDVVRVRDEWSPRLGGLLTVGVNVRGPARSEASVYRAEWQQARELDLPIAMHCAGTRGEVARIHQVRVLADDGLLGPDMLLAHCLYLEQDEQQMVAQAGIPVSVSPASELRLAMGLAPLAQLTEAGIDVSLSLDTTAIAGAADPFQAMRMALGAANVISRNDCAVTPRDILRLATSGGAKALGLDGVTGSITPGKRADLVFVRAAELNMATVMDPAVAIVHSACPANVDTVLIDGRVIKRAGRLVGVDVADLVEQAEAALVGLCARGGLDRPGVAR